MKEMQQQCQDLINKARTEKDAKIQECEELRSQVRRILIMFSLAIGLTLKCILKTYGQYVNV